MRSILDRYFSAQIIEESYSGTNERKIFNDVLSSLNKDATLVVTKLDRLCRSIKGVF